MENIDIAEGLAMLKGDRAIEQDVIWIRLSSQTFGDKLCCDLPIGSNTPQYRDGQNSYILLNWDTKTIGETDNKCMYASCTFTYQCYFIYILV